MKTDEKKPCDHKPDFYPSIMQWQCTVCGMPLRVSWPRLTDDVKAKKETA
ncbi:MAG: hypothetical protein LC793_13135 [Thermomicrobia bacterium]|nr:hypothetical protein [Thermomicrobia bacterium]MCA1723328.1 hypothetical protein [Thermomicrobia bacterium]